MTTTGIEASPSVLTARMRFPFRFGGVAVSRSVHVLLELDVRIDGARETGVAMGGLHPGWFFKDPDRSFADGVRAMLDTFEAAWSVSTELEAGSPFAFRRALYEHQRQWAAETDLPALAWNYGVSLVECAVIDAACRHHDTPFARAVREGLLGTDPGAVYDELEGVDPADVLPNEPVREIALRHTAGLTDPLTDTDLSNRPGDDGPRTACPTLSKNRSGPTASIASRSSSPRTRTRSRSTEADRGRPSQLGPRLVCVLARRERGLSGYRGLPSGLEPTGERPRSRRLPRLAALRRTTPRT
jgi:hypothetical protein